jgi:hypothetical protein
VKIRELQAAVRLGWGEALAAALFRRKFLS